MPTKTKLKLFIGLIMTAVIVYYSIGALLPLGIYLYIKSLHGQYGEALSNMWHTNQQKDTKTMKLKRTK